MFVFEMFKPFLDCDYMAAECAGESVCVCVCVCVRAFVSLRAFVRWCVFPREVIFSPVMNPDGENLFLYPLLLLSSSPSGSDSGVRLCFFIGSVVYGGNDLLCLGRLEAASSSSPPPFPSPWFSLSLSLSLSLHVHCLALNLLSLSVSVCGVTVKLIQQTRPMMALKTRPSAALTGDLKGTIQLLEYIYVLHITPVYY